MASVPEQRALLLQEPELGLRIRPEGGALGPMNSAQFQDRLASQRTKAPAQDLGMPSGASGQVRTSTSMLEDPGEKLEVLQQKLSRQRAAEEETLQRLRDRSNQEPNTSGGSANGSTRSRGSTRFERLMPQREEPLSSMTSALDQYVGQRKAPRPQKPKPAAAATTQGDIDAVLDVIQTSSKQYEEQQRAIKEAQQQLEEERKRQTDQRLRDSERQKQMETQARQRDAELKRAQDEAMAAEKRQQAEIKALQEEIEQSQNQQIRSAAERTELKLKHLEETTLLQDKHKNLLESQTFKAEARAVQFLTEMHASKAKEILGLINDIEVAVSVQEEPSKDVIVRLQKLVPDAQGFEGKAIRSWFFGVRADELQGQTGLRPRNSRIIEDWRRRRDLVEKAKVQQIQDEISRRKQPTRRTVHWLNKTVENIFRQRLQYFRVEAAQFAQRQQQSLFEKAKYLQEIQQIKALNLSMKQDTHATITNERLTSLCAKENLVKNMYEQVSGQALDENAEKFTPVTLSKYIVQQYLKLNLGQTMKAETFVTELTDATARFGRVSSQARFLLMFWRDEVPNYQVYKTLAGIPVGTEEDGFAPNQFEVYRRNYWLTEREFVQIRANEPEITCCLLLLYQEIQKHAYQKRCAVPEALLRQVEREMSVVNEVQWQNASDDTSKIPKYFTAQVVEFPRHRPFLGNVFVQILNDFCVQAKLLIPKDQFPQWLSAGFIVSELEGFKVWAQKDLNNFEAEVWCLLEAIVRVFNAVLEASKEFLSTAIVQNE